MFINLFHHFHYPIYSLSLCFQFLPPLLGSVLVRSESSWLYFAADFLIALKSLYSPISLTQEYFPQATGQLTLRGYSVLLRMRGSLDSLWKLLSRYHVYWFLTFHGTFVDFMGFHRISLRRTLIYFCRNYHRSILVLGLDCPLCWSGSTFDLDLCVVYNQRVMSEWLLSPTNPRRGSGVRGSSIIYCCEDIFCVLTLSSTNPLRRGSRVLEHPCCRLACVEVEACCFFWVFLLFFWFLCVFFLCRIFILCIC